LCNSLSGRFSDYTYIKFKIVIDQGVAQIFEEIAGAEFHSIFSAVNDQFAGCN